MDNSTKSFIKLRGLLYTYFEFSYVSRIEDLDDFTQDCLTDIESSYRTMGSYSRLAIKGIIENMYFESGLVTNDWGGLDEALDVVVFEFINYVNYIRSSVSVSQ